MLKRLFHLGCVLVALFALYTILAADDGLAHTSAVVDGIPVEVFGSPQTHPISASPRGLPIVVVAHGYAGSKQLMSTLARHIARTDTSPRPIGVMVVTFDFSGHGANLRSLPIDGRARQLDDDLDRVVKFARTLPRVDPDAIILVGHSMGASAVVRYANAHPGVRGVVAISAVSLEVSRELPPNLLLMAGAWEFGAIRDAQQAMLASAGGESDRFSLGFARSADLIPATEHITILWSKRTATAAGRWVYEVMQSRAIIDGLEPPFPPGIIRLFDETPPFAAAVIALACFFLFFPLATFAATRLGLRAASAPSGGLPYRKVLLITGVPAVLTPLILRALSSTPLDPAQLLPIQIVNYLAFHFLLYGALMALLLRLAIGRGAFGSPGWRWRALVGAALFFAWTFLTNGVVAHLTWMNFLPTGARLWLLPTVFLLILPYFVVNAVVTEAASLRRSALNELAGKALLIGSLLLAVVLTPGLFFLVLIVVMFALFFMLYGAYALHLQGLTGNPLDAALAYAAMTSALLVAVFPVTA